MSNQIRRKPQIFVLGIVHDLRGGGKAGTELKRGTHAECVAEEDLVRTGKISIAGHSSNIVRNYTVIVPAVEWDAALGRARRG